MKSKITDKELLEYTNGILSKERKKEIELKAIRNGETNLLLYSMMIDYDINKKQVEDLIEQDDDDVVSSNKERSAKVIFDKGKMFFNYNNENSMNEYHFPNEILEQVTKAIHEHEAEIAKLRTLHPEMSYKEAGESFLKEYFNISRLEAEDICEDIILGVKYFNDMFHKEDNDTTSLAKELASNTKDLSEEEKKNCYVNILTALQVIRDKTISESALTEKIKTNSQKSIKQLEEAINHAMDESISVEQLVHSFQDGIDKTQLDQVAHLIETNKEENRFFVALWLYIVQRDGKLKLSQTDPMQPKMLGILGCSAIEFILATNEWKNPTGTENTDADKQTMEERMNKWKATIKKILHIIASGIVAFILTIAIAKISLAAVMGIVKIICSGLLLTLVAAAIFYVKASPSTKQKMEAIIKKFPMMDAIYTKYLKPLLEMISSYMEYAQHAINKGKELVGELTGQNETGPTQNPENTEDEENLIQQPLNA